MRRYVGAVATALVLASVTGVPIEVRAADGEALSACPPTATVLTPECASQLCEAVSAASDLETADQAVLGRNAAMLIRDYGDGDADSSAKIVACVTSGPTAVFASYSGSEIAKVGEDVPASEQ
ncbi:MAG: hypothetical protein KDK07_03795 [Bauldia sp.]|nr:hypothetical protein [Bauldia sp.]